MHDGDLKNLLSVIKKRAWIIIFTTILFPVVTGIISIYYIEPLYQTYATLLIGRPQGYEGRLEYSDILLSQKLTATYSEIAKSRHITNELNKKLGLNISNEEARRKFDITSVKDTEIIKIAVIDKNPVMATTMTNELSNIFIEYVSDIMRIDNIQVVDKAEVPEKPLRPNVILNIIVAAASGIMAGLLLLLFVEYFDDTIKTQEDIEKYFMMPVLGTIPKAS